MHYNVLYKEQIQTLTTIQRPHALENMEWNSRLNK